MLIKAPEVTKYVAAVMETFEEHQYLLGVPFEPFFTDTPIIKQNRYVLGCVTMPDMKSKTDKLLWEFFEEACFTTEPSFYIIVDESSWREADEQWRLALIYHELCHIQQKTTLKTGVPQFDKKTGLPVIRMVGHEVEEFLAVYERFGDWNGSATASQIAATKKKDTALINRAIAKVKGIGDVRQRKRSNG